VITLEPAAIPVTNPVLLIVATPGDADTQGLEAAGVPEPVNCVVDPIQTPKIPDIVGDGLTVTASEAAALVPHALPAVTLMLTLNAPAVVVAVNDVVPCPEVIVQPVGTVHV
jgi:hypothetical protein